jgi:pimeloyl-ACP methyl ester carboxylesterase
LLLISPWQTPLSFWPVPFVKALSDEGYCVLLFDNRDIGRSQLMRDVKMPNVVLQFVKYKLRIPVAAPYQLTDMMRDTTGLLDALDIDHAHVIGASMGGMIAQLLGVHAPKRVDSLTLCMSTTGNRRLPGMTKEVAEHVTSRPASSSPEDQLAFYMKTWRLIGSPAYPASEDELQAYVQGLLDRGITTGGTVRQMLAIMAAPSRVKQLRRLDVPALVIHGDKDPVIPVECGIDTANAIPGATLEVVSGMGHNLPLQLVSRLARAILAHVDASGR